MTDLKLKSFAERINTVRENAKADIETIMEQAGGQDIDAPGLRRLAAWMGKDEKKRAEQEAIDDQMRFLAGLLPEPAELPVDGQIATARALFAEKASVRDVATAMKISVGKAHQLKTLAAMFTVQEKMNVNTSPKSNRAPQLAPETWRAISAARDAFEADREGQRQAALARRRAEREATVARNAQIDADPLTPPPHLDRRSPSQVGG